MAPTTAKERKSCVIAKKISIYRHCSKLLSRHFRLCAFHSHFPIMCVLNVEPTSAAVYPWLHPYISSCWLYPCSSNCRCVRRACNTSLLRHSSLVVYIHDITCCVPLHLHCTLLCCSVTAQTCILLCTIYISCRQERAERKKSHGFFIFYFSSFKVHTRWREGEREKFSTLLETALSIDAIGTKCV